MRARLIAYVRAPGMTLGGRIARGLPEAQIFAWGALGLILQFVAAIPAAIATAPADAPLVGLLSVRLMAMLFFGPFILYALAAVARLVAQMAGGQGSYHGARAAVFAATLGIAPLSLVAGWILPQGPGQAVVSAGFLWLWLSAQIHLERAR